jgi:hypothetical protein
VKEQAVEDVKDNTFLTGVAFGDTQDQYEGCCCLITITKFMIACVTKPF